MPGHIFGRSTRGSLPVAAEGEAATSSIPRAGAISTGRAGRRSPASAIPTRRCARRSTTSWTGWPSPIPASSPPNRPSVWPTGWRRRRRGDRAGLSRLGRIRGGRGGAEARAAVFHGSGPARPAPGDRPPPELPRQHARRAGRRRQRMAPGPVRAASGRDLPCLALLRISRPGRGREPRGLRAARGRRAGGRDPAPRSRDGDGLRGRAGGGGHGGRRAGRAGLSQARPRDLRPARGAAHSR